MKAMKQALMRSIMGAWVNSLPPATHRPKNSYHPLGGLSDMFTMRKTALQIFN